MRVGRIFKREHLSLAELEVLVCFQEDEKKKKHKHKKKEKDEAAATDEKDKKKKKSRSKKSEVDELEDFLGGGGGLVKRDDGDYEEL